MGVHLSDLVLMVAFYIQVRLTRYYSCHYYDLSKLTL
jgi:hypothetical protein